MKKITFQIITIAFVFCLTGFAQASLVELDIEHHFPSFGTVDVGSGVHENVKPGTDVPVMHFGTYDVNVEDDRVIVDFLKLNQFAVRDYNGLVLRNLVFESGDILLGVDVVTNGWDEWDDDEESRLTFGGDFVAFNWQGLTVDSSINLTAVFDSGPNPIPIPATLLLFVSGIAGFTLIRRKITK